MEYRDTAKVFALIKEKRGEKNMKKVYYTKEELKKLFESPIWKMLHENNVDKYFPKKH